MDKRSRQLLDKAQADLAMHVSIAAVGAHPEDIFNKRRNPRAVLARQVAFYLSHVAFGMSFGRVGAIFDRDRTTICHAIQVLELRREEPDFDAWMQALEESVTRMPVML